MRVVANFIAEREFLAVGLKVTLTTTLRRSEDPCTVGEGKHSPDPRFGQAVAIHGRQCTNLMTNRFASFAVFSWRPLRLISFALTWKIKAFNREERRGLQEKFAEKTTSDAALRSNKLLSFLVQNSPGVGQCFQLHTGSPLASRSEKVSLLPLTISRARKTSASPCFTFEPVMVISSPLAKAIPISSKKDFGHR